MKLVVLLIGILATVGHADPITCKGVLKGKRESVTLELNHRGKIMKMNDYKWGIGRGTYLGVFGKDIENYGFEWQNSFIAPNGFSILVLGTTADSHTIGVNIDTGKGFYTYKDLGSGAGNLGPVSLNCE